MPYNVFVNAVAANKIAISNHRLLNLDNHHVSFRYKDYRDQNKNKVMTLDALEFLRRFSMHILPKGFMRIRHFGILSSSRKQKTLPVIHEQLHSDYSPPNKTEKKDWKQISITMGFDPDCCPLCKKQTMITVLFFDRRGPPDNEFIQSMKNKIAELAIQK